MQNQWINRPMKSNLISSWILATVMTCLLKSDLRITDARARYKRKRNLLYFRTVTSASRSNHLCVSLYDTYMSHLLLAHTDFRDSGVNLLGNLGCGDAEADSKQIRSSGLSAWRSQWRHVDEILPIIMGDDRVPLYRRDLRPRSVTFLAIHHYGWSARLSGRTLVSGQRSFAVLRSTCSWQVTTYVGKPSAIGQPTRPTQPFILSGSINE